MNKGSRIAREPRIGLLGVVDDFRTANWVELVQYPELMMKDLQRLLATT